MLVAEAGAKGDQENERMGEEAVEEIAA